MKDLLRTIWNILRYTDRFFSFIRNTILNTILLIGLIMVLLISLNRDKGKESISFPEKAVLKLDIRGDIVEQKRYSDAFESLLFNLDDDDDQETALPDILNVIRAAKDDDAIHAIFLDTSKMGGAGLNQLTTIGTALHEFEASGKKVIAADDNYTQGRYYLASWANTVLLNPMGSVNVLGFGHYSLYFREAIEKLKMKFYIFKVGTYKSAVEPFLRDTMSEADREQSHLWLDALWQDYTTHVTVNRHLAPDALQKYTDNMVDQLMAVEGDSARMAVKAGLVDKLVTRPQIKKELENVAGKDVDIVTMRDYLSSGRVPSGDNSQGNIGIIVAEGNIVDGKAPGGQIGGDSLARLINEAQKQKNLKAVVLRINSGGGSAFASELIRQQLLALKKSGCRVVVSMGSIAASGGYWIAADADKIIADPTTLTGSIGVFGVLPNASESLQALGVYSDGVGTTTIAAGANIIQPLSTEMQSILQLSVESTYSRFLRIVAKGRKLPLRAVARIAEGRVYAGVQAKQLGLVDELGTMERAIAVAGELAGVEPKPTLIRRKLTVKEQVLQFFGSTRAKIVSVVAGENLTGLLEQLHRSAPLLQTVEEFNDPKGIYSWKPEMKIY